MGSNLKAYVDDWSARSNREPIRLFCAIGDDPYGPRIRVTVMLGKEDAHRLAGELLESISKADALAETGVPAA